MRKWIWVIVAVCTMSCFANAITASFSSAEGYSAGELNNHPDWTCSTGAGLIVDPAGAGSMTMGTVAYKNASFVGGTQSSVATSYTASALFTFEGTLANTQGALSSIFSLNFMDGSAKMQLLFRRAADGKFDLGFWDNSGSISANANTADFSAALLGLEPTLSVSDQLRISLTITRGADETDWSYSGILENIDTASTISALSGALESSLAFFTNNVVAGLSSAALASAADISPVTFHEFGVDKSGVSELNTWEPPAGTASNSAFSVSVRRSGDAYWTDLFVYHVLTGHQDRTTTNSSMVCFDFSGTVDVKVTYNPAAVSSYEIRPLSYGIGAVQSGQTITFPLTQNTDAPRKLVLRVNGSWDTDVLHILTNPPETNAPAVDDPNVYVVNSAEPAPNILPNGKNTYYFKPGVHNLPKGLWVDVDLQAVHSIDRGVLTQGVFDGLNLANRFLVETKMQSNDTYNIAYDGTANSNTGTVSFAFAPTDARYVRLTLLGNNTPGSYFFASLINELEIYAEGNPTNLALNHAVAGGLPSYGNAADGRLYTKYKSATNYGIMHVGESFFMGRDNTTVYIAPGAIVRGAFISDSVNHLTIRGRGMLDGSGLQHTVFANHPEGKTGLIGLVSGSDNRIEGITLLDSPGWSVVMNYSVRPVVQDINFIGSNVNADGVHMSGCTSGTVSGVFLRTPDDLLVMYHYAAGSWNTFKNSVLWNDDARVVLLGLAGDGTQPISHITFRNLDILNQRGVWNPDKYNGCFSLWPTGGNLISDILFDDIRIDPFQNPGISAVFFFQCNEWQAGEGGGNLQNITLNNITYRGAGEKASLLKGADSSHTIDGVYFYNYLRQGILVTNTVSGNISVTAPITNIYYNTVNTAPVVGLTAPDPVTVFTAPASIKMQADVSDVDGMVSQVDFYNGTQLIGTAHAAPWICTWTNVPAGAYSLSASAVDNAGGIGVSAVAAIAVVPPFTYEAWASTYGVPSSGAETNDSDHDGFVDLLEYAWNSDPTNAAAGALLYGGVDPSSQEFKAWFNRNVDATDIVFKVEFTPSLLAGQWSCVKSNMFGSGWEGPAPYAVYSTTSGTETVSVSDTNMSGTGFVRVRIVK